MAPGQLERRVTVECFSCSNYSAIYWRWGLADSSEKIYMCLSCANATRDILGLEIYKINHNDSSEHCDCGARTGGGRCGFCNDLRDKELSGER